MLPKTYTPEAARAGITQEQIEDANHRDMQAAYAGLQAELNSIPVLRARATEMMAVLGTGPGYAMIHNALSALDASVERATRVVAARQLRAVIEDPNWVQSVNIALSMPRPAAHSIAAEAAKPKPLTIEERLTQVEVSLARIARKLNLT